MLDHIVEATWNEYLARDSHVHVLFIIHYLVGPREAICLLAYIDETFSISAVSKVGEEVISLG